MKRLITLLAAAVITTSIAFGQEFAYQQLTPSRYGGKYGYVDHNGKTVIKHQYDYAENFQSDGVACVTVNGKQGIIDMNGNMLAAPQYSKIYTFNEGLALAYRDGKCGYLNLKGEEAIEFKYKQGSNFSNGTATVRIGDKYGVITASGRTVVPCEYDTVNEAHERYGKCFSSFARLYVESRIKTWQQKGMYEKTADWQARVNQQTRNRKIEELTKEAEKEYIARNSTPLQVTIEGYDADNEVFMLNAKEYGRLLVPVPLSEAPTFEKKWSKVRFYPRYFIENDFIALAELMLAFPSDKIYKYSNTASLNYTVAQVDYNFDPIEIVMADGDGGKGGSQNISTVNISVGKADVDVDIPSGRISNAASTFAVIIANENYQRESKVEFARNDGETFRKYCTTTLGLPEKNVHYVADATLNNMRAEIDWVCRVAKTYDGSADIIFYYAGHGIPDESTRASYLLPVDGYGYNVSTGYKLSDLYDRLGSVPAGSVTVFLDACFSGTARDGMMLASARGVAIKARADAPTGKMVVFSAAQGDETAYPYREKGHGLFTYYLLKKLQQTKGNVTYGELGDYITEQVGRTAIVENSKPQTPTVMVAPALAQTWKSMEF